MKFAIPPNRVNYALSYDRKWLVTCTQEPQPSLFDVNKTVKIGGLKIHQNKYSKDDTLRFIGLTISDTNTGNIFTVKGLPVQLLFDHLTYSKDNNWVYFNRHLDDRTELWAISLVTLEASRVVAQPLHSTILKPYYPLSEGFLLILRLPEDHTMDMKDSLLNPRIYSTQPIAQQGTTPSSLEIDRPPLETKQYLESQLVWYVPQKGFREIKRGIISKLDVSPDERSIYFEVCIGDNNPSTPIELLPREGFIYDFSEETTTKIVSIPVYEKISVDYDNCSPHPRHYCWRLDEPRTLTWVQVNDSGEDILYQWHDLTGQPQMACKIPDRYHTVYWGTKDLALIIGWSWKKQTTNIYSFSPSQPNIKIELVYRYTYDDPYGPLDNILTQQNRYGKITLLIEGDTILFTKRSPSNGGDGGSLIDLLAYSIANKSISFRWRGGNSYYERVIAMHDNRIFITQETRNLPPRVTIHSLKSSPPKTISPTLKLIDDHIQNPTTSYYWRADGVELSTELFIPTKDLYDPNRPILIWIYPKEVSHNNKGKENTSRREHRYAPINLNSPKLYASQGYVVVDHPSFPIVRPKEGHISGESYLQQITMNCDALVKHLQQKYEFPINKLVLGGHSFGANMTLNALCHTSYFAGGILKSGAYNRALTPFGFQDETRTFWDDPEYYYYISPFNFLPHLNAPVLIIHGLNDQNPTTEPIQSKKLYKALVFLKKEAKMVLYPHEEHIFQFKESLSDYTSQIMAFLQQIENS